MLGVLIGYAISLPIVLYFQSNPILLTGEMAEVYATFGMEPVMPMKFVPSIFLNQSLVIFILSVVVVLYPLCKIRTLKPVEAMRS
jgi:ABC-type antimicrobial peptide transport system permease subunit